MVQKKLIQIYEVSPEELKDEIVKDVKEELQLLSKGQNPKSPSEYLTRKELSKILKVSIPTLIDWDRKGILHPYRIGNIIRYKSDELDAALIRIRPKTDHHGEN